jgi:hypothetical protein
MIDDLKKKKKKKKKKERKENLFINLQAKKIQILSLSSHPQNKKSIT